MQLSLQNFTSLVQNAAAAAQGACAALLDFTVGSVLRAVIEANASIALWLQWLILQVLSTTRAATSNGADLDSWVADFDLARLPAVAATGSVTFSRFTATSPALIQAGAQVKTADGTQIYTVVADAGQTAWSASQNGYVIAAGTTSAVATVQDTVAGSAGNVQANTVTLLASAINFVDTVTNALAFTNGLDAETDAALRTRFAIYIAGLSKGTLAAIGFAVVNVQQGLQYAVAANVDTVGNYKPGNFVVTIDDGTGNASTALQNAVYAAVDAVRSAGETFSVRAPEQTVVSVGATITTAPGATHSTVAAAAVMALTAYINSVGIAGTVSYLKVAQTIFDVAPGGQVLNIAALTLNGGTSDIVLGASGAAVPGTITVT